MANDTAPWIIVDEPVGGLTDQTARLDFAEGRLTFNSMVRRRGTASIPFFVAANDVSGAPITAQVNTGIDGHVTALTNYDLTGIPVGSQVTINGVGGYTVTSNGTSLHVAPSPGLQTNVYLVSGPVQYQPTIGSPVYLYDVTPSSVVRVFAGKFNDVTSKCIDNAGNQRIVISAVSLESVFDTILVSARVYENKTCGYIFNDLMALAAGSPVSAGHIDAGATLARFVVSNYPKISDLFDQLATASSFVWGVDPADITAYFHAPSAVPVAFDLQTSDLQFASFNLKKDLRDYRNKQIIQTSYDAFAHSAELFANADMVPSAQGQFSFKLLRPVNQVTNAWYTYNTQNHATGSFSGQPTPGDSVEVSFPQSGSTYNWLGSTCTPFHPVFYALGQIIIDPNGHVQKVTTGPGYSGLTEPVWSTDGGFVTDGPPPCESTGITWTDQGVQGFANNYQAVYVFVNTLDNTQWGQVLIGATLAETIRNFVDAINALDTTNTAQGGSPTRGRGVTFSWPTWENPLLNADKYTSGTTITVRNKNAGQGYIAKLDVGIGVTSFAWSAQTTSGGQTKFGTSVAPVGLYGTLSTPGLAYQVGSDIVNLPYPLGVDPNPGLLLQVEYTRADGDSITVENSAQVALRATIEHSTGKYQQRMTANPAWTNVQALAQVQAVLAAYCVIPQTFMFVTLRPGILAGYLLTISLATPAGFAALVNGDWVSQEVNAEWIPRKPWVDQAFAPPGSEYGHFRYTLRVVDVAQIGDFIDFWRSLGGGSSSGSAVVVGGSQASGLLAPLNPGQIFAVEQSQIAGLGLGTADNPTIVYVKDYSHQLIWTGSSFQFADGGSNYYVFSDHAPSPGSPAIENGWAPCDGSTVNYLKGDGTLASKTLPNLTGGSYFLELGTGTGALHSEVTGIVTGSVSVSGSVTVSSVTVSGSCSVSSITVTGTCTVDSLSVTGTCSGNTSTGYGTGNWTPALNIGISGSASVSGSISGTTGAASYSVNPSLSGNTGDANANLDSATFTVGEGSVSLSGSTSTDNTGISFGSVTASNFNASLATSIIGEACIDCDLDFTDLSVTVSISTTPGSDPGHNHSVSLSGSVSGTTVSGPASGQVGHHHSLSGATVNAGSHTHSFSGSISGGSVDTTGLYVDKSTLSHDHSIPAIPFSGTISGSGTGSGTVSASGTGTGTCSASGTGSGTFSGSGSITGGVSTGGKPARVSMQAWFRL